MSLKTTLAAPELPSSIPSTSQWLSGEGAGSWFFIQKAEEKFMINRYSPEGKLECTGEFEEKKTQQFNIVEQYKFVHLSHCKTVRIHQGNTTFVFERV